MTDDTLRAALGALFPAVERARWPFTVEQAAAALTAALAASAPDEGPHVHRIEYPSRCTGCEHLAAAFVASAPEWMHARPAAPVAPLPGQEVGHGCSPECNACRADRLAASAPDEGPREPTWSPTDPSTVEFPVDDGRPAASAPDEVSAAALRLALRTEMGWSVHEVEEFLGQYHLTKPLDEYDPQRLDGEYAALAASATDEDAPSDQIDEAWMVVKQAVVRYGDERGREGFRAAVAEERAARPAAPVALDEGEP